MEKWIKSISGRIPFTQKDIKIDVDNRNLIITGANGSGKTSLLRAVFEKVNLFIVKKQNLEYLDLERSINNARNSFNGKKQNNLQKIKNHLKRKVLINEPRQLIGSSLDF